MSARRWSLILAVLATLVIAAVTPSTTPVGAHVRPMRAWPQEAQAMARTTTARWLVGVPAASRIGAEPPGLCRRVDRQIAACPIAVVVLVHDANGRRPWRCAATARISLAGDQPSGRRVGTRCARFPSPRTGADPAAALGTAYAVQAAGDVSCLPAGDGRVTCVMSYRTSTGQRCMRAATTPAGRPERSIVLGAQRCR